jgi:hypothetical protein
MMTFDGDNRLYLLLDDSSVEGAADTFSTLIVLEIADSQISLMQLHRRAGRFTALVYNSSTAGKVVLGGATPYED